MYLQLVQAIALICTVGGASTNYQYMSFIADKQVCMAYYFKCIGMDDEKALNKQSDLSLSAKLVQCVKEKKE